MSVENVSGDVMTSVAGLRSSSSIARYSADEPELHISPERLAEQRGDLALHLGDVRPRPHRGRPAAQHLQHGLDLGLVVHALRVQHA